MKDDGFTLVEIIVTIGIIGILLGVAVLDFNSYSRKHNTEAQVKMMFTDLLTAKVDAMHRKMQHTAVIRVTVNPDDFTITDGAGNVTMQKTLKYPITTSAGAGTNLSLQFDTRGFNVTAGAPQAICIADENDLAYDSIVIDQVKINLAKKRVGAICASANCDVK
jgi:prepilin-type N-terminal cleavage/methylation domain-containing protein